MGAFTVGQTIGIGAAQSGVNAILGIGSQALGNYMNYRYNEKAADAADARTRNLYKDLYSPEAQLRMLKEAGLSPGLMYAGSGVGGATPQGAQGAGAGGPHMQAPQFDIMGAMQAKAQIDNLNADTRQKNADAKVTEETGIDKAMAETKKALSEAGAKEAEKALTEWQTAFNKSTESYEYLAKSENLTNLIRKNALLEQEVQKAVTENKITSATANDIIKRAKLENQNLVIKGMLMSSQKDLTEEQCRNWAHDIESKFFAANVQYENTQKQIEFMEKQLEAEIGLKKRGQNIDATIGTIKALASALLMWLVTRNPSATKTAYKGVFNDAKGVSGTMAIGELTNFHTTSTTVW